MHYYEGAVSYAYNVRLGTPLCMWGLSPFETLRMNVQRISFPIALTCRRMDQVTGI